MRARPFSSNRKNSDLTLLIAAGLPVPDGIHGRALQPILDGKAPGDWRKDILYTYYDGGIPRARCAYNMPRHMGVRDRRYKLIHYFDHDAWEFYDLQSDPSELNNIHARPSAQPEVARLKGRLTALKVEFDVPEPPALKVKEEENQRTDPQTRRGQGAGVRGRGARAIPLAAGQAAEVGGGW